MGLFLEDKSKALENLENAKNKEWFDERFENIITFLNSIEDVYTTSCCSGRISVYHIDMKDSKKEHEFLGKFHEIPDFDDILSSVSSASKDVVYYTVDPAILHVCCKDLSAAEKVLDCAYFSGFKRSGIFQLKGKIMIEVRGVDGFRVPLSGFEKRFVDEDYLRFLLDFSAVKLEKNWAKMDKFYVRLKKIFC